MGTTGEPDGRTARDEGRRTRWNWRRRAGPARTDDTGSSRPSRRRGDDGSDLLLRTTPEDGRTVGGWLYGLTHLGRPGSSSGSAASGSGASNAVLGAGLMAGASPSGAPAGEGATADALTGRPGLAGPVGETTAAGGQLIDRPGGGGGGGDAPDGTGSGETGDDAGSSGFSGGSPSDDSGSAGVLESVSGGDGGVSGFADGISSGDASGRLDLGGCTSVLVVFGGAAATVVSLI